RDRAPACARSRNPGASVPLGEAAPGLRCAPSGLRRHYVVTPMLKQIGKRLATVIPSLIGVIIVTFLLTRVLRGDTAAFFAGPAASAQAIEEVRKQLGLDNSLPEQFVRYVTDLAHGDSGKSLTTGQSVTADIAARLPASAELTLTNPIAGEHIAVPLGLLAAAHKW